jgi:hypothetical protein
MLRLPCPADARRIGRFPRPQSQAGGAATAGNPLFRLVPLRFGKQNAVPPFEQQSGPIREVRFQYKSDGTSDGSVHQVWVPRGVNTDPTIPNCALSQPDFSQTSNLSFRIPLEMLGLGLIDSIQDTAILANVNATAGQRSPLGIGPSPGALLQRGEMRVGRRSSEIPRAIYRLHGCHVNTTV